MNLSRWFRWFPFAVGFKQDLSTVEQLRGVQQAAEQVNAPTRTHEADRKKLRIPRMNVVRKRA